jgi:hypothetical protein
MEDLKDSLKENAAFYRRQMELIAARLTILPKGTVKPKKIGGETFFYLQYRQGKSVKSDYVGKRVSPDLQEKLAERKRLESEMKQVREALKLLRETGDNETNLVEPLRSILAKLTKEKMWDSGFEIIGSWCFLLYQRLLPIEKYPLRTQDLDILIPLPYRGKPLDLIDFFKKLGFSESFNPDGSIFFSGYKMKVEFLGPEKGDGSKPPRYIKEIAITPQLLHYLDILFEEPLVLKVAKGVRAKVPAPAAFTIHKLIIATLFKRANKKEKDIRQAVYAGKYVLSERAEMKKMMRLWDWLPRPWKRKVGRALADALDIVPLEQGTIRQLLSKLNALPNKTKKS